MTSKEKQLVRQIGVISDTHGLLRPEAVEALRGVDLILHAGDIGNAQVLETLQTIAPVSAVRGNNDKGAWAEELPHWEVAEVGAISIYMIHDVKDIDLSPAAAGFQVVVTGHSHKASIKGPFDFALQIEPQEMVSMSALMGLVSVRPARRGATAMDA